MCCVCMSNPCHPRCPNAPEPKLVYICGRCGYGIFEGDKFFEGPDGYVCEECLEDMTVEQILEMLGENLRTA